MTKGQCCKQTCTFCWLTPITRQQRGAWLQHLSNTLPAHYVESIARQADHAAAGKQQREWLTLQMKVMRVAGAPATYSVNLSVFPVSGSSSCDTRSGVQQLLCSREGLLTSALRAPILHYCLACCCRPYLKVRSDRAKGKVLALCQHHLGDLHAPGLPGLPPSPATAWERGPGNLLGNDKPAVKPAMRRP